MALPAGSLKATVTAGGSTDVAGAVGTISDLIVAPEYRLVWAATGTAVETVYAEGSAGSIEILADQAGVFASSTVNGAAAMVEVRGWPLVARWTVTVGSEVRRHVRRFAAPASGTTVDLDMLPQSGAAVPGTVTMAQTINVGAVDTADIEAAVEAYLLANPAGGGSGGTIVADDTPAAPAEGESASYLVTSSVSWPAGLVWSTDPDGGVAPTITATALVSMFTVCGTTRAIMGATFPGIVVPDTVAPTWSATLTTGTPAATSVVVAASALATDAVGVTGYERSIDGGSTWAAVTPSGLNFTLTGLTAATAYPAPQFRAKDAAGNTSAVLTAQAFTTASGGDVTNPTPGTLASSAITSSGFTLTVTGASDAGGLHATPYAYSTDNGSTWSAWQAGATYNATGLTASTAYQARHKVRDAAANEAPGTAITVATTTAAASLADTILALNPVGYWKLDEASGTTITDHSANANHGVLEGTGGTYQGADGFFLFGGTGNRVRIPDHNGYSINTAGGLTVFYLYQAPIAGSMWGVVFAKGQFNGSSEWKIERHNALTGLQRALVYAPNAIVQQSEEGGSAVATGQWYARAVTFGSTAHGDEPLIYQGSATPLTTTTGTPGTPTAYVNGSGGLCLGGVLGASPGYLGGLAHMALFPGVLSSGQIQSLIDAATSGGLIP